VKIKVETQWEVQFVDDTAQNILPKRFLHFVPAVGDRIRISCERDEEQLYEVTRRVYELDVDTREKSRLE
jgi:hypothetical protein